MADALVIGQFFQKVLRGQDVEHRRLRSGTTTRCASFITSP
jgi:hypothetical protein